MTGNDTSGDTPAPQDGSEGRTAKGSTCRSPPRGEICPRFSRGVPRDRQHLWLSASMAAAAVAAEGHSSLL